MRLARFAELNTKPRTASRCQTGASLEEVTWRVPDSDRQGLAKLIDFRLHAREDVPAARLVEAHGIPGFGVKRRHDFVRVTRKVERVDHAISHMHETNHVPLARSLGTMMKTDRGHDRLGEMPA